MTTIAYDGKFICSDSRISGPHISPYEIQKLFRIIENDNVCIAISGALCNVRDFIDWINGEKQKPTYKDDSMNSAIAIDSNKKAWYWDSDLDGCFEIAGIEAIGSGAKFAMGAMLAGANAFRAVEVASKLDPDTGGSIQCYDIENRIFTGPFV